MTYHAHRRVDVTVGVAYAASLDATRAALDRAAMNLSDLMIAGEGRGYQVLLGQLAASSVDWTIRFWANTSDVFKVRERLTAEIKLQLMQSGIEIPFRRCSCTLHRMRNQKSCKKARLGSKNLQPLLQPLHRCGRVCVARAKRLRSD